MLRKNKWSLFDGAMSLILTWSGGTMPQAVVPRKAPRLMPYW